MRKIEILIVVIILFALAALVGCKDKAEAIEISDLVDITIEPNELFKIEETDATDLMFCYDHNGVTEELTLNVIDGEIVCSQPANKAIEIIFKTMYYTWGEQNKGDVYDLPVRFPEPNEPLLKIETEATDSWFTENWFNTTDLNEPQKVSLDFIPTWPDYIELEKDLWIEISVGGFGPIETHTYIYRKGTKIYFKE